MDQVRVLFVDDEPNVLQGLRRSLRSMRREWQTDFAGSGPEALQKLSQSPYDVVVSDMRMPGMDGAKLLNEILVEHPNVIRIILSGYSDRETIMQSVGATHQYLAKPCETDVLRTAIGRAMELREMLKDEPTLMPLISRIRSLPSLPGLYTDIVDELQSPEPSMEKVAEIITRDPAMTAKILQLVNSSFFGLATRITGIDRAVSLLGLDTIKSLVLSAKVFSQFDSASLKGFSLDALWAHCSMVGTVARQIARAEGANRDEVNAALTAGLLHDLGQLILASSLPDEYADTRRLASDQGFDLHEVEFRAYGATHAGLGAYLLGIWGLPESIVDAVAFHHDPMHSDTEGFSALTAVHVANELIHGFMAGIPEEVASGVCGDYLAREGLTHRLAAWQAICEAALDE